MTEHRPDADTWALPGTVVFDGDTFAMLGGRCRGCGALSFPRHAVCAACGQSDIVLHRLANQGVLYAYTVVHQGRTGWPTPYALGYVDLDDGVRVCGPLDPPGSKPTIGARVRLSSGILRTEGEQAVHSHRFEVLKSHVG